MTLHVVKKLFTARHLLFALLAAALCLSLLFALAPNDNHVNIVNEKSRSWNEGWSIEGAAITLPYYAKVPGGQEVTIAKTIDAAFENSGMSISILTSMQNLSIRVDGAEIYRYDQNTYAYMKLLPPPAWHIVRLSPDMIGKTISISYLSPLNDYGGVLNEIAVGSKFATVSSFLAERFFSVVLCFIIFLFGLICIVISIMMQRTVSEINKLIYFGIFACLMSLWSACETRALQILTGNVQLLSLITYLSILLSPVALLLFFQGRFQGRMRNLYNGMICLFSLYFILMLVLQLLGRVDFIFHFAVFLCMAGACGVVIIITLFMDYFHKKSQECKLYILAMLALLVFCLADFLRFYFGRIFLSSSGDSTMFTRIGISLFILIVGYLVTNTMIGYYKNSVMASTYKLLAHTDSLTGLHNRSYMQDICAKVFLGAVRDSQVYSLLIVDIDNFKAYNDFYGHVKGDQVLTAVSAVLDAAVHRPLDAVIRYGGEEFLILLPGSSAEGAAHIAEKLLQEIEGLKLPHKYGVAGGVVTASAGLYSAVPQRGATLESFIEYADRALYEAKSAGKNRSSSYTAALPKTKSAE